MNYKNRQRLKWLIRIIVFLLVICWAMGFRPCIECDHLLKKLDLMDKRIQYEY